MLFYILRRLASAISVVIVTLIASFALFFLAPTDPAGVICGNRCTPERIEAINDSLGLDEPAITQIGLYMKGIVVGRTYTTAGGVVTECPAPCLGYSYTLGQPVTKMLADALPVTLSIVLGGAVVYFGVGVLTGTLAAKNRGSTMDKVAVGTSLLVNSVPYFVVALLVALYATVFPPAQYTPLLTNPWAWASGLLAAWMTLGLTNAASYTRYSRASMIETLGQDYIRTARSKGISERRVVYRHGVRAGLTPVVTILGLDVAFQLTNAIFTESIFGLPGLGLLSIRAFYQYDLPVLMGTVLLGSVVLVLMNLVVDIVYTFLDPRVRLG
ncbi:peptide/nickel transport system permease protein [Actinoplanes campanulatus]|uniref:Peptide/nickel transport system permease protein n=1 Tax=Actinoplanes campanulatus TaxID=113559 RepID=A0A7W5AAP6_9ACTN|nr:ABC transporter permease [Actinoplanes campanulatus]MBB3092763.1 peptide/nickel transport system permease protein [Actinoplanes campanulatus]GGM98853.1 peptide ABC transporter permease [Actinoplanes campanulatus]GID34140.1 peptide ABC transporter permease [Actinoplanes campanulatus]